MNKYNNKTIKYKKLQTTYNYSVERERNYINNSNSFCCCGNSNKNISVRYSYFCSVKQLQHNYSTPMSPLIVNTLTARSTPPQVPKEKNEKLTNDPFW